ncbi:FG-GAP-like repeat-containing protein [Hymenobacter sp. GOD-10R]|uniref:FG-GAP-like repeat-containing protein n=1 Tax=Hymenobacter sp. GOD-10R TaxID=3093922 RepID=UPI002D7A3487|nr:FG-GAP-like repeat-containing protein [Hymenobacter sp. GOD-10R]WRQ28439.1 FG-GAP-like repeat-containing protein [Hymenobacter sp. GOD-10R]
MALLTTLYNQPALICTRARHSIGALLLLTATSGQAQNPTVVSLSPARNARSAPRTTDVTVGFSQALSNTASTQQALKVFSQQAGGKKAGTATVNGNTLSFNPTTDFKSGEIVFATVTASAQSTSGAAATPHIFQFTTAVSPSTGTFISRQEVPVGVQPVDLASGDLDGDGDPDLLTADFNSNTVSVRRNDGTGSFSGNQTIAFTAARSLALGDIDGDGDLDLVVGNYSPFRPTTITVSVRFNDGAGNFSGNQTIEAGATDVSLSDIDGDGDLDLLSGSSSYSDNTVSVRLNNGAGIFSGNQEVTVNGQPSSLATADVDNDGDLDLLTVNPSNSTVSIRLNNGQGTFSGTYYVTVTGTPVDIAAADVDGDGDLDFITANGNGAPTFPVFSRNVGVQLNNGNGTFAPAPDLVVNGYTTSVATADIEGDGDLDLLISYSNGVALRLNNGTGTFSGNQDVSTSAGPQRVIAVDVDNDGDLDLLTPNSTNDVSVRLNQNATPSTPVQVTAVSPTRNARAVARTTDVAVSFNYALSNTTGTQQALRVFSQQAGGKKAGTATANDNTLTFNSNADFKPGETVFTTVRPDVVTSSNFTLLTPHVFQFTTATSPSAGRFGAGSEVSVSGPNSTPASVATGDVDGDGDLDLLTANQGTNSVSVRLNNGGGTFSGTLEVSVGLAPLTLVLGDVDGDGDLDFATANGLSTAGKGTVSIRLNNGNGTFAIGQEILNGVRFNGYGNGLALNDMDGDGDLDVVTSSPLDQYSATGVTSVHLNNGDGTFTGGAVLVTTSPFPKDIAVGDVDNDGDLDILTANATDVSVRLNYGLGTFGGSQQVAVSSSPLELALGDLDGNGTLDLVTANSSNSLSIRLNTNGIFGGTLNLPLASAPLSVSLGDVDGDADLDLVVVRKDANGAEVYLNNGAASFTASQTIAVGSAPAALTLGDVDGDGTLDLLTANSANQTVSVRLNKIILANAPAQLTEQVSLYPNPAHTSVRLLLPAELAKQRLHISVVNSLGQVVLTQNLAAHATPELPLAQLAAGVYSLQLQTSQGLVTKRLVVE